MVNMKMQREAMYHHLNVDGGISFDKRKCFIVSRV